MAKTKKVRFRKITVGGGYKKLSTSYDSIKEQLTDAPELRRVINLEQKRRAILNNRNLDPKSRILLFRQISPGYDAAYARYRDTQSLDLGGDDDADVGAPPQRQTPKQILKSILKTPASTPASTPATQSSRPRRKLPVPSTSGTPVLSPTGKSLTPKSPRNSNKYHQFSAIYFLSHIQPHMV